MTHREKHMREQANTVLELTKGFTPEKRQAFSNETSMMETLAFYVLELTDEKLVFSQVGQCPSCESTDVKDIKKPLCHCKNCGCEWE